MFSCVKTMYFNILHLYKLITTIYVVHVNNGIQLNYIFCLIELKKQHLNKS